MDWSVVERGWIERVGGRGMFLGVQFLLSLVK